MIQLHIDGEGYLCCDQFNEFDGFGGRLVCDTMGCACNTSCEHFDFYTKNWKMNLQSFIAKIRVCKIKKNWMFLSSLSIKDDRSEKQERLHF